MDELKALQLRKAVLTAKGREGPLSSVEVVELEVVSRLIREWEAGYRPVAAD